MSWARVLKFSFDELVELLPLVTSSEYWTDVVFISPGIVYNVTMDTRDLFTHVTVESEYWAIPTNNDVRVGVRVLPYGGTVFKRIGPEDIPNITDRRYYSIRVDSYGDREATIDEVYEFFRARGMSPVLMNQYYTNGITHFGTRPTYSSFEKRRRATILSSAYRALYHVHIGEIRLPPDVLENILHYLAKILFTA